MTDFRPGKGDAPYIRNSIKAAVDRAEMLRFTHVLVTPDTRIPGYGFRIIADQIGFPIDSDLERNIFEALVRAGYARPDLLEA